MIHALAYHTTSDINYWGKMFYGTGSLSASAAQNLVEEDFCQKKILNDFLFVFTGGTLLRLPTEAPRGKQTELKNSEKI